MTSDDSYSEGDTMETNCPECDEETEQEVLEIKHDDSGFSRCGNCEKVVVHMAGFF